MRRVRSWSCWSCVGLVFLGLLGETTASHVGRPKRHHDTLHWVAKAQVTAPPLLRRDDGGSLCPITAPVVCPASLSGGCCSSGYECATDSCYATTAGPTTACGKAGFFACGAGDSGGCCPVGYLCGPTACAPPAGATETHTSCPFDYFLCPSSLNYGCCMTGMGCGLNECYSTAPVTTTITEVFTSTAGDETITRTRVATTVSTPSPPTVMPTKGFVPKFTPTAVPKSPQIPTKTSQDTGLTKAQLGGIIGGVVALLIIVIAATVLIIRHLKRVTAAVESSQKDPSGGSRTKTQSQAQMAYYGGHLHLTGGGDDNRSIDPLMVTPNTGLPGSGTGTPQIGGGVRERSDSDAFSPLQNGRGDSVDATGRHTSVDSPSYFDLPPRPQNVPGGRQQMSPAAIRESADSHATGQYSQYAYHHWRQHSNASELSGDGSEALGSPIPELDSAGAYAELPGVEPGGSRSRSSSVASPRASFSHARKRSESNGRPEPGAAAGFGPLDVVSESAEVMHGYYGPKDKQAGQTAAGLDVGWDISSPVAAARPLSQPMMLPTQTSSTPYTPDQQSPQPQQQQQQPQQEYQHQQPQQEYHPPPQPQQEYYQQPQVQAESYQLYQQYQQQYEQQEQQPQQHHYAQPQPGQQNPQYPPQPHYPSPSQ